MIIGIDPGAKGALAFLASRDAAIMAIRDMPTHEIKVGKTMRNRLDIHGLVEIVRDQTPEMVIIEKVGAFTGQSPSAAFTFGYEAGEVFAAMVALGFPVCLITPQAWKKKAGLPKDKDSARRKAMETWPGCADLFKRVKDDGRAEAALIGRHYWQSTPR